MRFVRKLMAFSGVPILPLDQDTPTITAVGYASVYDYDALTKPWYQRSRHLKTLKKQQSQHALHA